jgi:hypothetical protein
MTGFSNSLRMSTTTEKKSFSAPQKSLGLKNSRVKMQATAREEDNVRNLGLDPKP